MKTFRVEAFIGAGIVIAYFLSWTFGNALAQDIVRIIAAMAVLVYVIRQRINKPLRIDKGLPAERKSLPK